MYIKANTMLHRSVLLVLRLVYFVYRRLPKFDELEEHIRKTTITNKQRIKPPNKITPTKQ